MSPKLKVDLHTHTAEDPYEKISYTAFQLIDRASHEGFDALAITNHNVVTYNKELVRHAENKGILLIPGMEATFSKKHVLIINPGFNKSPFNRPLKDLAKIKNENNLIIAPHPFFPTSKSLKSDLLSHLVYFDAIEFSFYYNHFVNRNKKAFLVANQHKIPLVGTSDCHDIQKLGTSYTLVEAEKELLSIIEAVKKGKTEIRTTPISLMAMFRIAMKFFFFYRLKPDKGSNFIPKKTFQRDKI